MAYKPTRRQWIKLWVNEWLDGSTRFRLELGQRAIWVDLLALAGVSRFPGLIAAGKEGRRYVGYPPGWLASRLSCDPDYLLVTLKLLVRTGNITLQNRDKNAQIFSISIRNWEKYQSEYLRQRSYRQAKVTPTVTENASRAGAREEGEGEKRERRGRGREEGEAAAAGVGAIFTLYENLCGVLNPHMATILEEAELDYPAEWIATAFQEAAENNVRNWRYVKAILERYRQEGFSEEEMEGLSDDEREAAYQEKLKRALALSAEMFGSRGGTSEATVRESTG